MNEINDSLYDKPNLFSLSKTLIKFTKKVKEKSTELLLIPTVIGIMIQIFKLYSIDPFLIKFFSITQLIKDGIWILITIFPIFFIIPFVILFLSPVKHNMLSGENKDFYGVHSHNLFCIVGISVFTFFGFKNQNLHWLFLFITIISLMGYAMNVEACKAYGQKKIYLTFIKFYNILSFIGLFIYIYFNVNLNSYPYKIENFHFINKKIENFYPNYQHKILYLNDNYIFTKIYCDSVNELNSKILVIKTEKIFDLDSN